MSNKKKLLISFIVAVVMWVLLSRNFFPLPSIGVVGAGENLPISLYYPVLVIYTLLCFIGIYVFLTIISRFRKG